MYMGKWTRLVPASIPASWNRRRFLVCALFFGCLIAVVAVFSFVLRNT